jgi:predicted RNA-binding protein Jag
MSTTAVPAERNWIDAEIDLSTARIAALDTAMRTLANVIPWLDTMEGQQARATVDTLELRRRREETLRDQHEAQLRRVSDGAA